MRRILRSFLDSPAFTIFTESDQVWSILRRLPRSLRYYAKDTLGVAFDVAPGLPSVPTSQIEPWPNNTPLLSVIVPCYNYGRYIRETLQSVRSQTFQDFEIIVIDDGSTDMLTRRILEQLRQEGIRVIAQEHAPGPAQALNLGISAAVGKYVCCLNADDTIEPTYFEKCLLLLESNPGVSIAYPLIRTFGTEHRTGLTQPFNLRLLLAFNHVCAAAIYRKSAWAAVGGYDRTMQAYEDWDLWIRLGKAGFRGKLIPEPLFNWRRHRHTLGGRVDRRRPALLAQIRANHADLFRHPERIEAIERSYRDHRVSNPFLNLSSRNQYTNATTSLGLILTSGQTPQRTGSMFDRLLDELKEKERFGFLSVVTSHQSSGMEKGLSRVSGHTYNLTRFLEPHYWLQFVINIIKTRSIRFAIISNSRLGYDWSPEIKSHTPIPIVDVLHDPPEIYLDICLKHDSLVDYHLALSEKTAKSLTESFGISNKKVGVISASHLRNSVDDLSKILQKAAVG